ncbi:VWA domain-containing protein [Mahella australiensis]|uniref:von Willebrand factor type A n=1 Tax=Mahella australiensis (strain DSM 15567 / CIP 107919 / 50-1 BON) TaxID=697281 RepID=F3ZYI7_MAHA5|nr:VWA domain-containing protein [Mahella australiensis]AEE96729.1 von Willebrand factor type A [Mahella australiensis 50-1 BON]
MNFINPWGLLFGLSIPAIILLYLLKQQHEDVEVSSTFLWRMALKDVQASQPWQRFKRNLLLLLQLLAAAVMTLMIARPYLASQAQGYDYVVILDASASMRAVDVKPSRFDKAKGEIDKLIDGLLPKEHMSIITVDGKARIAANWSSDRAVLKDALNGLKPGNAADNMDDAVYLAQAMLKERKDARVYIYSDKPYGFDDKAYQSVVIRGDPINRAVAGVSYTAADDGIAVLSKVANFGGDATLSVECLADGKTIDVKEVNIPAGEAADVYWNDIPDNAGIIEIRILNEDDLMADNAGWAAIRAADKAKVLLITQRNAFLEKALSLRNDIEVFKTTYDQAGDMSGYRLYIFDGYMPAETPKDGNIIVFNPKGENDMLKVGASYEPSGVKARDLSTYADLMKYVRPEEFHIAKAVDIEVPTWADVLFGDETHPLMLAGEQDSRRIAAFAFDLHDSDMPLKMDFPILMQNVLAWMLPPVVDNDVQIYAGSDVDINPLPQAENVNVITPSGKTVAVAPPFPPAPFAYADEVGVYTVEQRWNGGSAKGYFTVTIPTEQESDLAADGKSYAQAPSQQTGANPVSRTELKPYLAWLALLLVLIEWQVYQRGY